MQGYIPYSDEFMAQDPESIDQYREWQRFARFLEVDRLLRDKKLRDKKLRDKKLRDKKPSQCNRLLRPDQHSPLEQF